MFSQEPSSVCLCSKPSGLWKFFPKSITVTVFNYMCARKTGRLIKMVRIIGGGKRYKPMPLEQIKFVVFVLCFNPFNVQDEMLPQRKSLSCF